MLLPKFEKISKTDDMKQQYELVGELRQLQIQEKSSHFSLTLVLVPTEGCVTSSSQMTASKRVIQIVEACARGGEAALPAK
ncbi:hypothetical protein GLOTRDRAFT_123695 [Gloeophyllum trabeum ATCC 11539]|uniref:Uncharacterized protein n=1 Tax=Gloeophyllum trabeum (strain ATCC 11539 / FP-39264 / Madison 617) TaxID=670483 RepID=S7RYB6_GLOTA|nr:uncharacterized protein GLOTRDRAFT_123695 [Gloeophyllum trabeum ATCC 11539]EPQ59940.1 hypothetical protein GLOTRDRAFT_123695 [Gloeophyllum trabeum ATCC 11539]